jgi:VIT1/CCC1 family predicted Fe2+/Mn2+ transporter
MTAHAHAHGHHQHHHPRVPHVEKHFTASDVVRDIVIGMSDGLTVPFALAAGLSGAVAQTGLVVTAGLAEIAAGSIAMGLGGYLAAKTDMEHYESERRREYDEVEHLNDRERQETFDILKTYGLTHEQATPIVESLAANPDRWVDWMMKFELNLDPVEPKRARNSALTIAGAYVAGGLVPLAPYMVASSNRTALIASVCLTLLALAVFGAVKARFTGIPILRGGLQTVVTGGLAAGAAYTIASLIAPHA